MAKLWNKSYTKGDIQQYAGDITQIAGTKSYELNDGKAHGVRAIDIKTGSGLNFTVLPDRCMDIAWAEYKGKPISFITKNGIVSSKYYEPQENGWFRSYFGGLLTTCGLSNTGAFCEDGGEKFGLHGRISNTPAERVNINEYWDGEDFNIEISGKMRESNFYGENLLLTRGIKTKLGEKRLVITDKVDNLGYSRVPLLILYHFNFGFPILDETSQLILNKSHTVFYDQESEETDEDIGRFAKPTHEYYRKVSFHTLKEDSEGNTICTLINRNLDSGPLGVYLKFNRKQLPEFFVFKMMGQSDYQIGLEPSNCLPMGRSFERSRDGLKYLEACSSQEFEIEVGIVEGNEEIEDLLKCISDLGC